MYLHMLLPSAIAFAMYETYMHVIGLIQFPQDETARKKWIKAVKLQRSN